MRRAYFLSGLPLVAAGMCAPAHSADNTLRLVCTYTQTVMADGRVSRTSGDDLVTVTYAANGRAIIRIQDVGAELIGTVTPEEISGETTYQLDSRIIRRGIWVNRYTGKFKSVFQYVDDGKGMTHYGSCRPVNQSLF
jgi:hypothetical protein